MHDRGVKEGGGGSAICDRKPVANGPLLLSHVRLDHGIGRIQRLGRMRKADGIFAVLRSQSVSDDLLHRSTDVKVEEALPEARLEPIVVADRQQWDRAGILLLHVLNDDARLRYHAFAPRIVKDRDLPYRPP